MPSVGWLLCAVIAVYSLPWKNPVVAASEQLPVASNGWRPIVGTHEVKPYINIHSQKQNTAPSVKQTIQLTAEHHDNKNNEKNKVPANQNIKTGHVNQLHINHHGSTGHHSKFHTPPAKPQHKPTAHGNFHLNAAGKPALRHPVLNKFHAHMTLNTKRNKPSKPPARPQHSSHSIRDEMMAQAPSSAIGSYAYFNQGPLHLQNKPFLSSGPHVDFTNHFSFSNDVVLPQTHFSFPKHPSQNELQSNQYIFVNQNDEFTRNLVPPPPLYKPQGEKESVVSKQPPKIVEQSTINNPQFVLGKHKEEIRHIPENLVVQLPPPYSHYQQTLNKPLVDLEITKENFREFHTTLAPSSYATSTEPYIADATKFSKPQNILTTHHGYEVTEEKEWPQPVFQFKPFYSTITPTIATASIPPYKVQISTAVPEINKFHYTQQLSHPQTIFHGTTGAQFLPTPYNPGHVYPTSPTQVDVSTIYTEMASKKRPPITAPETANYNIKEVSTHFPIYLSKNPDTHISIPTEQSDNQQHTKEKVTNNASPLDKPDEVETTTQFIRPTQKSPYPTRDKPLQRRPSHRRRRPSRPPTSSTESHDLYGPHENSYVYESENMEIHRTSEKPYRRRRPPKYRTTESPEIDEAANTESINKPPNVVRYRPTRPRPQTITEEVFESNHRYRPIHKQHKYPNDEQATPTVAGQNDNENAHTTAFSVKFDKQDEYGYSYGKVDATTSDYRNEQNNYPQTTDYSQVYTDQKYLSESTPEPFENSNTPKNKRKRIRPYSTTTEILPSTNLKIPENELDYTTIPTNEEHSSETITIKEVYDFEKTKPFTTLLTTLPTTTTTTTTTTEAPSASTKSNRIRQRPLKYEVQRPRFSVRDYRLRLNQYMSTSTEQPRTASESPRVRYSNRLKTPENEETTDPVRQRFVPKDPRHKPLTTDSFDTSTTEKQFKTINTRLRPFGRYRASTETPSTSTTAKTKVSIRPNIFNNLRRPPNMSLRTRIYSKKRNETQSTTEASSYESELEQTTNTAKTEVTIPFELAESSVEATTEFYRRKFSTGTETTVNYYEPIEANTMKPKEEFENIAAPEEAETFLQLQRISDLTSSAHKTPGLFKSVSSTSRRVPNYFTLATEDPILPIEAFFPNLNKNSEKQM